MRKNKKIKKTAIIWRKSIYDNDFKCRCNYKLINEHGTPKSDILVDMTSDMLFCPLCKWNVAKVEFIKVDKDEDLGGNWDDFKRSTKK